MDDNLLMKISLTISIVGLFALFFASQLLSYETDINTADIDSKISMKGKVSSIHEYENSQIIELTPYTKTRVILFDKKNIEVDDSIEILGKVDEYQGRKEVIAEEVRKI